MRCRSNFYSKLKKAVHIGSVALDESVPTPSPPPASYAHKPLNYLAKGQSDTAGTCFIKPSGEDKA